MVDKTIFLCIILSFVSKNIIWHKSTISEDWTPLMIGFVDNLEHMVSKGVITVVMIKKNKQMSLHCPIARVSYMNTYVLMHTFYVYSIDDKDGLG